MAKKKLLTSLLCVALVSPLAACNKNPDNSSNNENTNSNEVLETINNAAVATKNKLAEELKKDVVSIKVDFGYTGSSTEYLVEVEKIYQNDTEISATTETHDPETYSGVLTGSLVGNLDNKYYTDFLATEGNTTLTNSTVAFAKIEQNNKQFDKDNKEEYSSTSLLEARFDGTEMVTRGKQNENVFERSQETDVDTNYAIASVVAGLKEASTMSEEDATSMFKQILMGYMNIDTTNEEMVAQFESLYNTVFGFLGGSVTSQQVVDTIFPMLPGSGDLSEDDVIAMKKLFVALLDYVKALELTNIVKYATTTEDGETVATLTFDYAAFKTFVSRVFDELTKLFTENIPDAEAEDAVIEEDMAEFEETFLAALPETLDLSVSFGIKGGLISSFAYDVDIDGFDLAGPTSLSSSNPSTDGIEKYHSYTSHTTAFEMDAYVSFEFGTSAYTIPDFSISVPVAQ